MKECVRSGGTLKNLSHTTNARIVNFICVVIALTRTLDAGGRRARSSPAHTPTPLALPLGQDQLPGPLAAIFCEYGDAKFGPYFAILLPVPRSVGFRMVVNIFFCWPCPLLWIELFDELCFMVLFKSVDIIPTEMVELLAPPIPPPAIWMVPEGCRAASIPFCLGEVRPCLPVTFFLMRPFWTPGLLSAMIPPVSPCGWYCVYSCIFCCWCS